MRLQEMYYIVKSVLERWPVLDFEGISNSSSVSVISLEYIDNALCTLYQVKAMRPSIDNFRQINRGLEVGSIRATLTPRERDAAEFAYKMLITNAQTIVNLCESLEIKEGRDGFDIKMPSDITLQELSSCTKDLDFVFTKCPILQTDGEIVSLSSVDIGSIWLTFVIAAGGGIAILGALAAIIDKAIVIRSHMLTCKAQEDAARTVGLKNDMLESIVAANKEVINRLEQNAADELAKSYEVTEPEEQEKLRRSLDLLSNWMSKGMEIYAAIGTQNEIKAVFPPIEMQKLPDASTKMITDGNATED